MQRRHSTEFKVKVVLEALRERKTLAEVASEHGVHAVQISQSLSEKVDAEESGPIRPSGKERAP